MGDDIWNLSHRSRMHLLALLSLCLLAACDAFTATKGYTTSRATATMRSAPRVTMAAQPFNRRELLNFAAAMATPALANAAELGYRPSKAYAPGGTIDSSTPLTQQLTDLKAMKELSSINTIPKVGSASGNLGVKGAADAAALGIKNERLAAVKAAKAAELDQKAANQAYAISGKGLRKK